MPPCQFDTPAPEAEYVYGACEPGWDQSHGGTIDEWIAFVQSEGVRRVCCLLSDAQVARFDGLLDRYREAFGDDRVAHVPVTDHTLVPESTLREAVLPFLDAAADAEEPVVVHCKAGIGRTGQALAAWLVHRHGYEPIEAVETVSNRHRRPDDAVRAGNATREELLSLLAAVA